MSVFAVDANGGLVREGGAFKRVSGLEEIAQGLQLAPQYVRGEIPTDVTRGLPWFGDPRAPDAPALLGKDTPLPLLGTRVRARLAREPGVVEITELTVSPLEGDSVTIDYVAKVSTDQLRQRVTGSITVG